MKQQRKETSQQTQTIIQDIQQTHGYSSEIPVKETTFIDLVSPRIPNKRWTVDLNHNIPTEREKTVMEAKQRQENY